MCHMTIDYEDCSRFIKEKLLIDLFPYQEIMLKAFCDDLEVRTGRAIGRSFVADAFGKYVASLYSVNHWGAEPDICIPVSAAVKVGAVDDKFIDDMKQTCSPEDFKKEMLAR